MIIEIYYEGALTMFFTTESAINFNSIRDVIRAYPDWKLMMQHGTEIYFLPYVESCDPDYIKFWERVQEIPEESVFQGIAGAVNEHENDSVVIYVSQSSIDVFIKYGQYDGENKLDVFYKSSAEYFNLIVTKNSPLGPILQHGSNVMFERGMFDYLTAKWLGRGQTRSAPRSATSSDNTVLTMKHVLLAFEVYGLVLLLCLYAFVRKREEKHIKSCNYEV